MKLESENEENGIDHGPRSAAAYGQRIAEKKQLLEAAKSQGKPLGGAPPIPEGKMSALIEDPSLRQQPSGSSVQGVGSAYPINQELIQSRNVKGIPLAEAMNMRGQQPQAPGALSPESIEALKMVRQESEKSKDALKQDLDEADKDIADKAKSDPIPFDIDALVAARHPLLTKERKKAIEEKLEPLDISDLIMKREIVQKVSIIKGKFDIELRTFSQREHLWLMQYLYEHPGSDRYVEELFNTLKIVCSVVSINGMILPDHRDSPGKREEKVDKKLFEEKLFHITSLPVQILADIGVQCNWFNDRVQNLFTLENLKNG